MCIRDSRVTVPVGVAEEAGKAFMGDNFKMTLKDLEGRMREAAANLEFANDALSGDGETADRGAVKKVRAEAKAEADERFRKARLGRRR